MEAAPLQCVYTENDGTPCSKEAKRKPGSPLLFCDEHRTLFEENMARVKAMPTVAERLDELEHLPVIAMNKPQGAVSDS